MSSVANNDAFVTKNAGFVLKLRLVGVGGAPQIRRVKLERLVVSGVVSYEALVGLAIQYTFPGAPLVLEDYEVALTYYDVDNDCVTIASTEELVDAVDQFSTMSPPVLRLTTDVKRKKTARSPPASPQRDASSSGRNQRRRGNSPGRQATQQLQTLLESFVGILATAVVALQSHMNPPASVPATSTDGVAVASAESSTRETSHSDSNVSDTSAQSRLSEASSKLDEAKRFVKEVVDNINMEKKPEEDKEEEPPEEERQFIHGRHTCDACLVTPIVGPRYHAINLPDYDLCSKCLGNYKGDEIKFEAVELDRDRPFQERWHRRRARWAGGRGRCRPHRRASRKFVVHPKGMDAALEEAIRRSLEGSNKEVSKKDAPVREEPKEQEEPKQEEVEATKEEEPKKEEADAKNESFASAAVGSGETAEALGQTLDQCAEAIDAMMSQLSKEASSVKDVFVEEFKKEFENKQPEPTAPVEETDVPQKDAEEDVSAMTSSVPSLLSNSEPEVVVEPTIIEAECVNAPPAEEAEVVSKTPADDGAMILESTEHETGSQASEDEWQVVTDDAQVAGDEMLARAFQMIGSALFQSDMHSSAEGTPAEASAMAKSTSSSSSDSSDSTTDVSSPSSVPSTVPSIHSNIPLAVQARWASQLSQLHELGFDDEAKCVGVLERLHAANVGVDEEEEVSVTQVVNELLKNN